MNKIFCWGCGHYHNEDVMRSKSTSGKLLCPRCVEKLNLNKSRDEKARLNMAKHTSKKYRDGGKEFENLIKRLTNGD